MQKFYKHHIQEGKDKGGELEEDIGAKAVEWGSSIKHEKLLTD